MSTMKKNHSPKPLEVKSLHSESETIVELKTAKANKYMGYPSTYAQCMAQSEYLTDTAGMSSVKAAGACAAQVEKMQEAELEKEEANLQQGYPGTVITTPAMSQPGTVVTTPAMSQPGTVVTTPANKYMGYPSTYAAEEDCPCAQQSEAASIVDYQVKDAHVEYTKEEKEQISKNLKESQLEERYWLDPKVDGKPYFGTKAAEKDYSAYLHADIPALAAKTKKQWEKIDKKELDRDSKKEKVQHEKDAVKDDQSKIDKLKKGKQTVKKQVEKHDLKKDQEFDEEDKIKYSKAEKGNLPPWLKDKKELDKDSKKEKVEHEKDAIKDDKKQIKDLKKDEKQDKKSEKKDKK
jgi:hypothetical protein